MSAVLGQLAIGFDQLTQQVKEWQTLLAGLLILLSSIIIAIGLIKAAKIRATPSDDHPATNVSQDLRTAVPPRSSKQSASIVTEPVHSLHSELENLRSLLRSALASLSSVDTNHENARLLCSRIAALRTRYAQLTQEMNKPVRDASRTLVNQFELLGVVLNKEWSPSEASAILIQLNASARSISANLEQSEVTEPGKFGRASKV